MIRYKILTTLLLIQLLAGCIVAVVAGAAAGVIVYDRRSLMVMENDIRIFHKINTAIETDPRFHNSHIVIISFNHVVLLTGETLNTKLRILAEKIAQQQPDVRRVYNEIKIGYPITLEQQTKDTVITGKVRSSMLAAKGLESGSIRIVTENNIVYLMGIVTTDQANLAVAVARQIAGVKQVMKVFQYIK